MAGHGLAGLSGHGMARFIKLFGMEDCMIYSRDYKAAVGAPMSDDQAKRYGQYLDALNEELNGVITPDEVVERAQSELCTLHDWFEWDDTEAAKEYRVRQARDMMRYIVVDVKREDDTQQTTRVFFNVKTDEGRGYTTLQNVMSIEKLREQVIAGALRELEGWTARYRIYNELSGVVEFIHAFKNELMVI